MNITHNSVSFNAYKAPNDLSLSAHGGKGQAQNTSPSSTEKPSLDTQTDKQKTSQSQIKSLSSKQQLEKVQEKEVVDNNAEELTSRIIENNETQKQQITNELKKRDRGVRDHERSHSSAGGAIAGAPTFTYTIGPDGERYAIHGKVDIDVTAEATEAATIKKMQQVRAAALAPADPSPADRRAAANATRIENQAQAQLMRRTISRKKDDQFEQAINNAIDETLERETKSKTSASNDLSGGPTIAELKMRQQTYKLFKALSSIVQGGSAENKLASTINIKV